MSDQVHGAAHVLTVTVHGGERDYVLECPGVTDACRAYVDDQCPQGKHMPQWDWRTWFDFADETVAHGVEHRHIDGAWMAATDRCLYTGHDNLSEVADELRIAPGVPLPPGRFHTHPSYEGEEWFRLDLTGAGRVQVQGDLYHGVVPAGAVYIGRSAPGLRASFWANLFKPGKRIPGSTELVRDVEHAIELFRTQATPGFQERVRAMLAGRLLACWCKPGDPCHGDYLLDVANQPVEVTYGLLE